MTPKTPTAGSGLLRSTAAFVRHTVTAVRGRLAGHDLPLLTAGLTFYAAIAVIPMLIVALYVAGLLVGHDVVADLVERLAGYAPANLGFRDQLVQLAEAGTRLGPLALLAALLPATTYGEGLVRVFDRLADTQSRGKGLRGRALALLLLGAQPLLVLVGLGAVAVLPDLVGGGGGARILGVYVTFLVAWLVASALLAVTYRGFSPVPLATPALLWGAGATGSFLAGMSLGWVLVLQFDLRVGQAYGGAEMLGTGVLFAIYLFLVQITCLVGYVLTVELSSRRATGSRRPPVGAGRRLAR